MSEIDNSREAATGRAIQHGSMFLNEVFRFNNKTHRILGNRGPRVSSLEVIWSVLCAVIVLLVGFLINKMLGPLGNSRFSPFNMMYVFIMAGIALVYGRRIANMSPLSKKTGEGTGVWTTIMFRKVVVRVSSKIVRPVMYNECVTNIDEDPRVVRCIEWIGTARAPRAPYVHNAIGAPDMPNLVILKPRGRRIVVESNMDRYKANQRYRIEVSE